MKAKEYLHQAYRLDKRIQSNIEEMERLREISTSVSSPGWGERIQTQRHVIVNIEFTKNVDLETTIFGELIVI